MFIVSFISTYDPRCKEETPAGTHGVDGDSIGVPGVSSEFGEVGHAPPWI